MVPVSCPFHWNLNRQIFYFTLLVPLVCLTGHNYVLKHVAELYQS